MSDKSESQQKGAKRREVSIPLGRKTDDVYCDSCRYSENKKNSRAMPTCLQEERRGARVLHVQVRVVCFVYRIKKTFQGGDLGANRECCLMQIKIMPPRCGEAFENFDSADAMLDYLADRADDAVEILLVWGECCTCLFEGDD